MSARSTHKGFGSSHVLPPNPTFLDFPRSDGNTSNWPLNTTYQVDNEGHVNYMREVALDEPLSIKWRVDVGAALASRLNMDREYSVQSPGPTVRLSRPSMQRQRAMLCEDGLRVIRCSIITRGPKTTLAMMLIS